ncbi:MAG: hypothetical protein ACKOFW_18300, partial [Planctomycetaceae bacterium]
QVVPVSEVVPVFQVVPVPQGDLVAIERDHCFESDWLQDGRVIHPRHWEPLLSDRLESRTWETGFPSSRRNTGSSSSDFVASSGPILASSKTLPPGKSTSQPNVT